MPSYTVSEDGLRLIQSFEGFTQEPVALADGRYLYGFGQTSATARSATRADAESALRADIGVVARELNALLPAGLSQAQFDALASFAHSVGVQAFQKSDVLRRVRSGEFAAAAMAMLAWRKSRANGEGEVLEALVRRRIAEQSLLLCDAPIAPAPSAWAQPEIDHACAVLGAPIKYGASLQLAARDEPLLLTDVVWEGPDGALEASEGGMGGDSLGVAVVAALSLALFGLAFALLVWAPGEQRVLMAGMAAAPGLAGLLVLAQFFIRRR